jgi:2-isopropylmalate synthase
VQKDIKACADALKKCPRPRIHTFIGTSDIHISKKLRKSSEEILAMSVNAVKYARRFCDNVEFSCEDTGRTELELLYRIVESVIKAGAGTVNLPDTVGYTVPYEFGAIIKNVFDNVQNVDKAVISVHCHNDLGMGVANSITAVQNGARQVECTVNGIGERAGNASLEEVAMIIRTRRDILNVKTGIKTKQIMPTSRLVSRLCNMPVQSNKAVVGGNAFAHSSGIHQDGVLKHKKTYEIMTPESVGLKENSHVIKHRLAQLGYSDGTYDLDDIYAKFLALADKKGRVYDDDLEALMEIGGLEQEDRFTLVYLNAASGTGIIPTATIKIKEGKNIIQEAATGDGPVDASYNAIDRATGISVKLRDYSLTAKTGGREALGEVSIVADYKGRRIHGTGSSTDIVEASALAYVNIINKICRMEQVEKKRKSKKK